MSCMDILELIVNYLKHHNGKKPEEIVKPIRSVKMKRIVADKWDADYINGNLHTFLINGCGYRCMCM